MKKIIFCLMCCLMSFSVSAGDKEVLQQVYGLILDNYIDNVEISSIFNPTFKALETLDKDVKIILEKKTVTIYYKGKMHKIYSRPKDEKDAKKWGEFTAYLLEEIKKISPKLEHKDFELVEVMLYHGIKDFDKNCHYYPTLEIGQEKEKIQGYNSSILDNNVLYIRLGTINDFTKKSFIETMKEGKDIKGIILDLRGNKGGYLKQALEITDSFISEGVMIYSQGKETEKQKTYVASEGEFYKNIPMIIIVDGKTASAAEVIVQTLREHNRAQIIGAQTYGKDTVQNIYRLENGGYISLTTEQFIGSRKIPINDIGIRPNVCSEVFAESSDIDEMLEYTYNFVCPKLARHSTYEVDVAMRILEKEMSKEKTVEEKNIQKATVREGTFQKETVQKKTSQEETVE